MKRNIGILHPGQMGISVAASAQNSACTVYWVSEGRSPQTHERAAKLNLVDAGTLAALCQTCNVLISLCPPRAAEEVSDQVIAHAFRGLYVDANAISPRRSIHIGQKLGAAGVTFVDGGIIGEPAWRPGKTWLYLSGPQAEEIATCFSTGLLQACVIGDDIGKASALKMCYAANTKGTTALLGAILAAADALGILAELEHHWSREGGEFAERAKEKISGATAKAWRYVGEMNEIAATFRDVGLPGQFHDAAADIYGRLAGFKDSPSKPSIEDVLSALIQPPH